MFVTNISTDSSLPSIQIFPTSCHFIKFALRRVIRRTFLPAPLVLEALTRPTPPAAGHKNRMEEAIVVVCLACMPTSSELGTLAASCRQRAQYRLQ